MSNWEAPLCRYLHRSLQVLWFQVEEWYVLGMLYFGGLIGTAFIWLFAPLFIFVVFPATRKKHRSHFRHVKVLLGLTELNGYPPPTTGRFYE